MKVSVLMPTYNHEKFIAQAIDSFLMQKCNFETELLIGDDCSTDNTLKIAKDYAEKFPEKVKIFEKKHNEGLLKNYKTLISNAKGEYFAILESDDYWTDEQKLQKQVDFLDKNPEYGISFTQHSRLRDGKLELQGKERLKRLEKYKDCLYESFILQHNKIQSPTVVFRKDLYVKYCNIDDYINLNFQTFDFPTWVSIIRHSKIHYLAEPTTAYRVIPTSISNSNDWAKRIAFTENIMQIKRYIFSLYGKGQLSDFHIQWRDNFIIGRQARKHKKFGIALKFLIFEQLNAVWKYLILRKKLV